MVGGVIVVVLTLDADGGLSAGWPLGGMAATSILKGVLERNFFGIRVFNRYCHGWCRWSRRTASRICLFGGVLEDACRKDECEQHHSKVKKDRYRPVYIEADDDRKL